MNSDLKLFLSSLKPRNRNFSPSSFLKEFKYPFFIVHQFNVVFFHLYLLYTKSCLIINLFSISFLFTIFFLRSIIELSLDTLFINFSFSYSYFLIKSF
nr:MAG TPA: hypothetical protein [Caudoviricetes sp.]